VEFKSQIFVLGFELGFKIRLITGNYRTLMSEAGRMDCNATTKDVESSVNPA
jgi:hypothetical protein